MKRWKQATALIILPAFLLQGCGMWMVDRGTKYAERPYEVRTDDKGVQRATTPYETSEPKLVRTETGKEVIGQEVFVPAHWEIIDDGGIPAGSYPYPKFDADPVWKTDKTRPNTFKAVEEYARANGYAILKNEVDFPARMTSGHNPPKIYLIPKGKYIVYRPQEQGNGDVILHPVEVPSCRNQLTWAPKIKWVPRTKMVSKFRVDKEIWMQSQRYLDVQTVIQTERYRDINTQLDAGAIVLAGLVGLGLGYLLWFGSAAAAVASGPVTCPPGFPAPRPPVP